MKQLILALFGMSVLFASCQMEERREERREERKNEAPAAPGRTNGSTRSQ